MNAENDPRYTQSSGRWIWVPNDPTTCNPIITMYPDSDSIYSRGSASPSLPSYTSPESIDLSHYEESPTIPMHNTVSYPQSTLPDFGFEPDNVALPDDKDQFDALLEEVNPFSSSEFGDWVDWSASNVGGTSPPSAENYYPSPGPANFPTFSMGNSPIDITPHTPASLPTLQPIPSTISQKPTAPYTCSEVGCGKGFNKMCDLRKHSQKHTKPYRCGLCSSFSSAEQRGLQRHYWAHHREWAEQNGVTKQMDNCSFPGCKYEGRLDNLRRHMKRHLRDKDKVKRRSRR